MSYFTDLMSGIINIWIQSSGSWSMGLTTHYTILNNRWIGKGENGKVFQAEQNIYCIVQN